MHSWSRWQLLKDRLLSRNEYGCPSHGKGEHLTFQTIGSTWDGFKFCLKCCKCADAALDTVDIPRESPLFGKRYPVNLRDEKRADIPPFKPHMTLSQAHKLKIGDKIDHRDSIGRFVFATVSQKQGTNLKIHYDGWSRKWDIWSNFNEEIHRFAVAGSISKRKAHRFQHLKKGDFVDINPTQRHPGWKCGKIRRFDQKSGQIQVIYESMDKDLLYWAHLDDEAEIAEFTSQSSTMQGGARAPHHQQDEYNQSDHVPSISLKDRVMESVRTKHEQFQSLLQSLNDNEIGKLDVDDTMIQIQSHYDAMIRLIEQRRARDNNQVFGGALSNNRKRPRSEFENSINSDFKRQEQIEIETQAKRRKKKMHSVHSTDSALSHQCGPFRIRIQTREQSNRDGIRRIGPRNFSIDEIHDILTKHNWKLIVMLRGGNPKN